MEHSQKPEENETSITVGKSKLTIRAEIPAGTRLSITVEAREADNVSVVSKSYEPIAEEQTASSIDTIRPAASKIQWQKVGASLRNWLQSRTQKQISEGVLFALALALYLITRLVGLTDFPIYFFTDEAAQTVLAADLVRDGFYNAQKVFLPTYFYNGYQYNLSTSVYVQLIPYLLFGKSIWVTRGVCVLITLLAAICVGLTIHRIFRLPHGWAATLLLSTTPVWFLHSRTAFETGLATTFFAAFICFYLLYRTSSPHYLFPAILFAALTFYSYSPARVVITLTAVLLLLSDLRYHWQQRRTVLTGIGFALLLALPFIRFEIEYQGEDIQHLKVLSSYWVSDIPLYKKLGTYLLEYGRGFNPFYWYLPNRLEMDRHTMKGYGHLSILTLPFVMLGLGLAIRYTKRPAYRTVLIALLVAPSGAALVAIGVTRALFIVIATSLLAALGICSLAQWLQTRWQRAHTLVALMIFCPLAIFNIWMTRDALTNGPLWYTDYGLGGMQYGAKQLFGEIKTYLKEHPDTEMIVSPSWANGTDTIARFFFDYPFPFQMGSIVGHITELKPLSEKTLFVIIPEELQQVYSSGKFTDIRIEKTLPYPNGKPGFYFIRLRYVDNIEEILAQEKAARLILQEGKVLINNQLVKVKYSFLDMGSIDNVFDGDPETLLRTAEANPLEIQLEFTQPQTVQVADVRIGGVPTRVTFELYLQGQKTPLLFTQEAEETPDPRTITLNFRRSLSVERVNILVHSIRDREPAHVHLWEVSFKP